MILYILNVIFTVTNAYLFGVRHLPLNGVAVAFGAAALIVLFLRRGE